MKHLQHILLSLCIAATLAMASNASLADEPTGLRCYYQEGPSSRAPGAQFKDIEKAISGHWADIVRIGTNMFYTNMKQDQLIALCQDMFKKESIPYPVATYAAVSKGNNNITYTIWHDDERTRDEKINRIISFGDSLSDMQNMFNIMQGGMPYRENYFAGRFTNGKNWLDYLSEDLNLTIYNGSVGGAAVDDYTFIPGVDSQIDSWVDRYRRWTNNYNAERTLFTVLIGGNDLVNYDRNVKDMIDVETQALNKLINTGARNILLVTLPDVSRAPVFSLPDPKKQSKKDKVSKQVKEFNTRLAMLTEDLKMSYGRWNLNIQLFDANALLADLIENPGKYEMTNATESCLDLSTNASRNYFEPQELRDNCMDPDTFVFWDLLHPTTKVHQLLAEKAKDFIQDKFKDRLRDKAPVRH